ncbi:MAG: radical SAM family heme chaperone HemW [Erysipelotrichaceae bacterium]|nr:radical SAM family heme chaperone HemW [Erysipelotrichaceae bacterium]
MMNEVKHLYVHVPFCRSICYYCDFCHRIYDHELAQKWLERFKKEIENSLVPGYETIYIGGGTPTALEYDELKTLLDYLKPYSQQAFEYTIEANPESLDEDKIILMKEYGINRISLGVQSTDTGILRSINRKHDFALIKEKIALLRKHGLDNISVDLMYSLPNQTLETLQKTLDDILSLDVPHISIYSLTIEENSVFGRKGISALDEEIEADMYELIEKCLTQNGYRHYEISNFCKEDCYSRHNMSYWNYEDFIGVSLAASSKIGSRRYTNTRSFERYFSSDDIHEEDIVLNKKEQMFEHIMMSLRTDLGLDIDGFERRYECKIEEEYPQGTGNPHIVIENGRMYCKDLAILNTVLLDFME